MDTQSLKFGTFKPESFCVGMPSLSNISGAMWERHETIAYHFARHARHDMVNLQCSLKLSDTAEQIARMTGQALPPELQPEAVKAKTSQALRRMIGTANDMVLLNQSTNKAAYRSCRTDSVQRLLAEAIEARLEGELNMPAGLQDPQLEGLQTVMLGDQLPAAISTFFFQWTRWLQPENAVLRASAIWMADILRLRFPADNLESVAMFARNLAGLNAENPFPPGGDNLASTTCESALWLARFIVMIHGGAVHIHPDDPELNLDIYLPMTR